MASTGAAGQMRRAARHSVPPRRSAGWFWRPRRPGLLSTTTSPGVESWTLAAADQLADQWKICDGTGPADQRIEACTWIIKSGNETKKNIAIAYGNRGAAYRAKDDLDSAIRDYDEVIKLDPKSASSYMFRGNGYRARGDYDRAIADYDTAIRLERNDAGPLVGRGNIYSAKNEYERAISDYNAALKIRPKYALAFRNRGIVYSKMKNFDHAIDDYSEAIR